MGEPEQPSSDKSYDGKLKRPRVLIVGASGTALELYAAHAYHATPPSLWGFEPVFVAYGPQKNPLSEHIQQFDGPYALNAIAEYAADPANGFAAVVTQLYEPAVPLPEVETIPELLDTAGEKMLNRGAELYTDMASLDENLPDGFEVTLMMQPGMKKPDAADDGMPETDAEKLARLDTSEILFTKEAKLAHKQFLRDVLFDDVRGAVPYGFILTALLRKQEFKGPVALVAENVKDEEKYRAVQHGALGVFALGSSNSRDPQFSAFAAIHNVLNTQHALTK